MEPARSCQHYLLQLLNSLVFEKRSSTWAASSAERVWEGLAPTSCAACESSPQNALRLRAQVVQVE